MIALLYHPDRNPGRESEVVARFQKIQSAHEVLIDPQERAKYDSNRIRTYNRYATGGNQRGNPWSNVSSQFPTPPKPPTARNPRPPPSSGAARYSNFQTPKQSAYQTAQEGAEARRSTYEAWERMRDQRPVPPTPQPKPGPGSTWSKPGPVPKDTPKSGREESNSFKHPPPPRTRPGYEEFRANYDPASAHRRAQSQSSSNRRGFTPNTPGGDEPAAPKGAYFTSQNRPVPPPPPPRNEEEPFARAPHPDPLKQFRQTPDVQFEERQSTPYATHGGEKFNPFETANMSRSKSNRVPSSSKYDSSNGMPRVGSDPNLNSPRQSFSRKSKGGPKPTFMDTPDSDSSSDDRPQLRRSNTTRAGTSSEHRTFAKAKSFTGPDPKRDSFNAAPDGQRMADGMNGTPRTRKPCKLEQFQQWWKANPHTEFPLNGVPPDGPPASGQSTAQTNGEPSMYDDPFHYAYGQPSSSTCQPSVSSFRSDPYPQTPSKSSHGFSATEFRNKWPNLFTGMDSKTPVTPPSGVTGQKLFPVEETQRYMLDHLIQKRNRSEPPTPVDQEKSSSCGTHIPHPASSFREVNAEVCSGDNYKVCNGQSANKSSRTASSAFTQYRDPSGTLSPPKKQKQYSSPSLKSNSAGKSRAFWNNVEQQCNANRFAPPRFSIPVDENTFQRTNSSPFRAHSTESINSKFAPEEWKGTFEGDANHFAPEQKAAHMAKTRSRAQSGSRSRGRSPIKPRPVDTNFTGPRPETEIPQSPGGTKFSKDEWAGTFKPQTFMPPPPAPLPKQPAMPTRRPRGPSIRPTMGTAAVIEDSDTPDEKPLFKGRKNSASTATPQPKSPDAMDVDTPPPSKPTTPSIANANEGLKVNTSPPKRAAEPSQSPTETEALKVNFEDLQIRDIITTMNLPPPPVAPATPPSEATKENLDAYSNALKAYMCDWDLFSSRMMLHLVARKNQNDMLGATRWLNDEGLKFYRQGVQEDAAVLKWWEAAMERHGENMKQCQVLKESRKVNGEARPRKKTA